MSWCETCGFYTLFICQICFITFPVHYNSQRASKKLALKDMNVYASDASCEDDEDEEKPIITLHPHLSSKVDIRFECPLLGTSDYVLAVAQDSAQQGCPQCILRTTTISQLFPSLPETTKMDGSHDYIFLPFHIAGQRIVLSSNTPPQNDEDQLICDFYGDQIGGLGIVERVLPGDTSSLQSLETVKKWIRTCHQEHNCMPVLEAKLPKRLLDVRKGRIRLHETTAHDQGLKYACLSHCWGYPPTAILRTTPSSLVSYQQSISYGKMPRTFRDAVSMTRKLGIAFLWIDSLCIVQDEVDKTDWHEQSANMANIYRNAWITLAATAANDADGGCYTRMDVPRLHLASLPLAVVRYGDGRERELFARRKLGHVARSLPLLQRGWVCQERLLSPRILHFVGEELVWECNAGVHCECGGDDLEDKFDRMRIFDPQYVVVGPHRQHPAPLDLWYSIVSEYTALSLTKGSDTLPALSGIAKAFAEKTADEYIAGMWKSTLVSNLLWFFNESADTGIMDEQATPWRAPSWSWASAIFGPEVRFLPVTKELAKVKEVTCKPSGSDPTGELETAHLTLATKILPACFDFQSGTLCVDNGLDILKAPDKYMHARGSIETGYFDLHPTTNVDIVLAQMASCIGEQQARLYGVHAPIHIEQEVRSYLVLARRENESWVRIGLATIADYTRDLTLGGFDKEEMTRMTRGDIEKLLKESAERNRSMFRRFDATEMRDIVLW